MSTTDNRPRDHPQPAPAMTLAVTSHNPADSDTYKQVLSPQPPPPPAPGNKGESTLEVNDNDCTLEPINRNYTSGLEVDNMRGKQDTDKHAMEAGRDGSGPDVEDTDATEQQYSSKELLRFLLKNIKRWWNGLSNSAKVWILTLVFGVLLVIIIVPSVVGTQSTWG